MVGCPAVHFSQNPTTMRDREMAQLTLPQTAYWRDRRRPTFFQRFAGTTLFHRFSISANPARSSTVSRPIGCGPTGAYCSHWVVMLGMSHVNSGIDDAPARIVVVRVVVSVHLREPPALLVQSDLPENKTCAICETPQVHCG
jgi:hypothetical protein